MEFLTKKEQVPSQIELNWQEKVLPHLKQFEEECIKLGISYEWRCTIQNEIFGGFADNRERKSFRKSRI